MDIPLNARLFPLRIMGEINSHQSTKDSCKSEGQSADFQSFPRAPPCSKPPVQRGSEDINSAHFQAGHCIRYNRPGEATLWWWGCMLLVFYFDWGSRQRVYTCSPRVLTKWCRFWTSSKVGWFSGVLPITGPFPCDLDIWSSKSDCSCMSRMRIQRERNWWAYHLQPIDRHRRCAKKEHRTQLSDS